MKPSNQLLIFTAMLMLVSSACFGQTLHSITLNVNTGTIENSNTDEVCDFGQDPGIANQDFTITVAIGDTVQWVGVSSNDPGTDRVEVTSINHEGGARVFGRNRLNDTDGIVTGVVTEGREGDEEKYKISFKVYNNGVKRQGTFHIDPKIKVGD